jgi:catechol 1,2-dioxygenase
VIDAERIDDPAAAEKLGLDKPFTRVEFNIQLVATDKSELQTRHERKRALEGDIA